MQRTQRKSEADVIIAGEAESMSRAPWVLPKPEKPFPADDASLVSTTLENLASSS
jgi:acetyl-CoA acyltransferase